VVTPEFLWTSFDSSAQEFFAEERDLHVHPVAENLESIRAPVGEEKQVYNDTTLYLDNYDELTRATCTECPPGTLTTKEYCCANNQSHIMKYEWNCRLKVRNHAQANRFPHILFMNDRAATKFFGFPASEFHNPMRTDLDGVFMYGQFFQKMYSVTICRTPRSFSINRIKEL